jgi:hypothetical protein
VFIFCNSGQVSGSVSAHSFLHFFLPDLANSNWGACSSCVMGISRCAGLIKVFRRAIRVLSCLSRAIVSGQTPKVLRKGKSEGGERDRGRGGERDGETHSERHRGRRKRGKGYNRGQRKRENRRQRQNHRESDRDRKSFPLPCIELCEHEPLERLLRSVEFIRRTVAPQRVIRNRLFRRREKRSQSIALLLCVLKGPLRELVKKVSDLIAELCARGLIQLVQKGVLCLLNGAA